MSRTGDGPAGRVTVAALDDVQAVLPAAQLALGEEVVLRLVVLGGEGVRLLDVVPFVGDLTAVEAFEFQHEGVVGVRRA